MTPRGKVSVPKTFSKISCTVLFWRCVNAHYHVVPTGMVTTLYLIQTNKTNHKMGLCSQMKKLYLLPCRVKPIERRTRRGMQLLMHAVRSLVECGSTLKPANFFVSTVRVCALLNSRLRCLFGKFVQ